MLLIEFRSYYQLIRWARIKIVELVGAIENDSTTVFRMHACNLASAAEAKVDLFLTNDRKLVGKMIPGIQFIAGLDVSLY